MRNLRDRLERLGVTLGPPAQLKTHAPRPMGIEHMVAGEVRETPLGPCFVTEKTWPATTRHGRLPLAQVLEHDGTTVACLARDLSLTALDWRTTAFIDVETSGLAGGTGVYTFLVGVGFFDGDSFRVRQFFMRDLTEEPALVAALDEFLTSFEAVVSYNGKSFDLPLLSTRFTLAFRRLPLAGLPHLDLLHLARRLWSSRLPSCTLSDVEKHILRFDRQDDVPGWLIPSLYFDYIRTGDAGPLRPVFRHNAWDILSLVALAGWMCTLFEDPEAAGVTHGTEWYSLGRCYEDVYAHLRARARASEAARWLERVEAAYRRALADHVPEPVREQACHRLSLLYKRRNRWEDAVALWHRLLEAEGCHRLYPYVELAKYYEHRRRDYTTALNLVRRALELAQAGRLRERSPAVLPELRHRLARLERRVSHARRRVGPHETQSGPDV